MNNSESDFWQMFADNSLGNDSSQTGALSASSLSIDIKQNAIDSLEKAVVFLEKSKKDTLWLKWIIIALHNALYGFMACALEDSAGFSTYRDNIEKDLLKYYSLPPKEREMARRPIERLDYFLELYKKIKDPKRMEQLVHSKTFAPQGNQDWSIEKLNGLRNDFMHFTPNSWLFKMGEMPQIIEDIKDIMWFLIFDGNNILINSDQKEAAKKTLIDLSKEAKEFAAFLKSNRSGDRKAPAFRPEEEIKVVGGE